MSRRLEAIASGLFYAYFAQQIAAHVLRINRYDLKQKPMPPITMEPFITSALLFAIAPTIAQTPPEQTPPVQIEVQPAQPAQSEPEDAQTPVTCPPGQFASAFSDVYPTDWAYQAVSRLASRPIECFDLPDNQ